MAGTYSTFDNLPLGKPEKRYEADYRDQDGQQL
jgi:hypothetical protein